MKIDKFSRWFEDNTEKIKDMLEGEILTEALEDSAKEIVNRTKKGYGVDRNGGDKFKLDALTDKYKDGRKRNKRELHDTTTPYKSNLTYSGDMLNSVQVDDSKIICKESDKVGWNADNNRPFFFISKLELKRLYKRLNNSLSTYVDKIMK